MKACIHIYLKPGVLDVQGQTIARSLNDIGFPLVNTARQGKVIELDLDTDDILLANQQVEAMCEKLLANPVIEVYDIEVMKTKA